MTLSPTERKEVLELAAGKLTEQLREGVDLDELNTLELSTAAQLLGLSVKDAARKLPVLEIGPRTRRVTVADYKAFLASKKKTPAKSPTKEAAP